MNEPTPGGISREEIASRPEAALAYPGSVMLRQEVLAEGELPGPDHSTAAMVTRWYRVTAEPNVVLDWYRDQLLALGWETGSPSQDGNTHSYHSADLKEEFFVTIRYPARGLSSPPGAFDVPGTNCDIQFSAYSTF